MHKNNLHTFFNMFKLEMFSQNPNLLPRHCGNCIVIELTTTSTYSVIVYLPSTSQVKCILHYAKEFLSYLLKVGNFSPYYLIS